MVYNVPLGFLSLWMVNTTTNKRKINTMKPFKFTLNKTTPNFRIEAYIRFNDDCKNGHNSFAITGATWRNGREEMGGCIHEELTKHFPKLTPFFKWHLCSEDGPMHYIENACYWAGLRGYCNGNPHDPPNMEHLKSTIVYGAVPGDESVDLHQMIKSGRFEQWLKDRLLIMLNEFGKAMDQVSKLTP